MKRRRGTAIIENEKGILLVSGIFKKFNLPGGGVKKNESQMQAVIREVKEETGIEPYFAMVLFRHESKLNNHFVYYIKAKGEPKPRREIFHIAYSKNKDIRISKTTGRIILKYLDYKTKHKKDFEMIERLYKKV